MSVLRISEREVAAGRRRVEVLFTPEGGILRSAESTFEYAADAWDSERVRWYLEESPEYPEHPAQERASLAETRLAVTGEDLFSRVFSPGDAAGLWTRLVDDLAGVRVEVDADPRDASGLPWGLPRDPGTGTPVTLAAREWRRPPAGAAGDLPARGPGRCAVQVGCQPPGPWLARSASRSSFSTSVKHRLSLLWHLNELAIWLLQLRP